MIKNVGELKGEGLVGQLNNSSLQRCVYQYYRWFENMEFAVLGGLKLYSIKILYISRLECDLMYDALQVLARSQGTYLHRS